MITELWNNLESIVALGTIFISAYIFFNDPIRRWRFFGYRPTALMVLVDPKTKKLVLVRTGDSWSFSQGGIYDSDIYDTVEDILERELSLNPNDYKLFYTKAIGTADLSKPWQKNYPVFGGIKFSSEIKGKGYIACLIMLDTSKELVPGYGVSEIKYATQNEATEIFLKEVTNKSKAKILDQCVMELPRAIETWNQTQNL